MLMHFMLRPGGEVLQPVPADHSAMAYVFSGQARLGDEGTPVADGNLAAFAPGTAVRLAAAGDAPALAPTLAEAPLDGPAAELLVLTGVPLNEPLARYGPFVMNTREEIIQAFRDYEEGRFGRIGE